ncbi:MAG: hypothetical protein H6945_13915 [Zoogloeaceae bacterium]|nr:hypothetical protein [Rhodocyclaceae bacterium]MCP5236825.1 hypothetical protein [Zoogloeaceae bacterium]
MANGLIVGCAAANPGFALFHPAFWRLFDWHGRLGCLGRVNRAVMQVMNVRLIYVFVMFAVLQTVYTESITGSPLGIALQAGIVLFWAMRAVEQVVFFGLAHPAPIGIFAVFVANALLHAAVVLAAGGQHA